MAARSNKTLPTRVGVVTVSYSSDHVIDGFLRSLRAATDEPILTIVVDNKADEATVQAIAERFGARYLPMASNRGYGAAINAGVAALPSTVTWVLVSNPDVTFAAGALDTLLAAGDSDPRVAAIGPAILTDSGDVYPSARKVPSLRVGIGHALFATAIPNNRWSRTYRDDNAPAERRHAGWLSGACFLIRRDVFDTLGGFDDGYFMYFEDVDLGYRIGKAGYVNLYEPAAVATHIGAHSTTTEATSAQMIVAHHDSARRFVNRKYSHPVLWPVRVVLGVGLRLRSWVLRRSQPTG